MELMDDSTEIAGLDVILTRIYRHQGKLVRVRVRRNPYLALSSARTEVFSAKYTWTLLASAPAADWFFSPSIEQLGVVADDLAARAEKILG